MRSIVTRPRSSHPPRQLINDQPGVAARIAYARAGEVVPLHHVSVPRLRAAIERVLNEPTYRENAARLQRAIARSGEVRKAADIVEQALSTGQPVIRPILKQN